MPSNAAVFKREMTPFTIKSSALDSRSHSTRNSVSSRRDAKRTGIQSREGWISGQSEKHVKFVDPRSLPERSSPTRYGSKKWFSVEYVVRVFDGSMSETKQEYEKKKQQKKIKKNKRMRRELSSENSFSSLKNQTRRSSNFLSTEEAKILEERTEER